MCKLTTTVKSTSMILKGIKVLRSKGNQLLKVGIRLGTRLEILNHARKVLGSGGEEGPLDVV